MLLHRTLQTIEPLATHVSTLKQPRWMHVRPQPALVCCGKELPTSPWIALILVMSFTRVWFLY